MCLLLSCVALAGIVTGVPSVWVSKGDPLGPPLLQAAGPLAMLLLSVVAYAVSGIAFACLVRHRQGAGLLSLVLIAGLNMPGYLFAAATPSPFIRWIPSNPAVVLASPGVAAVALMERGAAGSIWQRFSLDQSLLYGFGYSLVLALAALALLRWLGRRAGDAQPGS